ncbi:MAG: Nif11-like leader peptide family natural product precursor [Aphanothece sp. CMT-3BRIN-NPC111]|jgi:predicted ribosomally synthesized peptide with nif11-like leader|nr:Nif11-like leader peptide family natural product precursor [Aphanothece sp. CMT-3BRIN-NPC111]
MSKESVKEFFNTAINDPALRERLNSTENAASVVSIASESGYEVTEQDVTDYMQEMQNSQELDESQLESVAGGAAGRCNVWNNWLSGNN